jgi:hypothetical protein
MSTIIGTGAGKLGTGGGGGSIGAAHGVAAKIICGPQKTEVACQVGTIFAEKKAALVIQFSSHSAMASYQSLGLSLAGCPTGIVVTWSWISHDSLQRNLMAMASLSVPC